MITLSLYECTEIFIFSVHAADHIISLLASDLNNFTSRDYEVIAHSCAAKSPFS